MPTPQTGSTPTPKWLLLATVIVLLIVHSRPAPAQTFTTLYSFTGGADGGVPEGSLLLDAEGNLYGTTSVGGAIDCYLSYVGCGTAFELTPSGSESVLHSFGRRVTAPSLSDGANPEAGLLLDGQGNLYGTTYNGGTFWNAYGTTGTGGTVFVLTPTGVEKVLHNFSGGPDDGANPYGSLVSDGQGNLYGITQAGGANGQGTVFEVTASGAEKVLYSFTGGTDGGVPNAPLVLDAAGNLYGTTFNGGAYDLGTVFMLTTTGEETILYSFAGGADAQLPGGGVIFDSEGNLYGTTVEGGTFNNCNAIGCGTVFELTSKGYLKLVHSFAGSPNDGSWPLGSLAIDAHGNLYGTTYASGAFGYGTLYQLAPGGAETILHNFSFGSDGGLPTNGVILDSTGDLYGTTPEGALDDYQCDSPGCGTVFEFTP
jgi:uncharacterized repeat protein (TIGR03803 family)